MGTGIACLLALAGALAQADELPAPGDVAPVAGVPALPPTPAPAAMPTADEEEPPLPLGPEPAAERSHPYLAAIETALGLAGGTVWYWWDSDFNSKDWELKWDWPSWRQKIVTFEAVRFDDNKFDTNSFWHPLDGTGLYVLARGNRLSPLSSFLMVAASSVAWEYLVEYRERVSVNDMIYTPLAGFALGEPAIRASQMLRTGSSSPLAAVAADVLDPVGTANRLVEGRPRRRGWDGLRYRHRVDLGAGYGSTDFGGGLARAESDLVGDVFLDMTPDSRTTGRRVATVGPGAMSYVSASAKIADGRSTESRIETRVSWFGRLERQVDGDLAIAGAPAVSRSFFIGLGSGFEYGSRSRPTLASDDEISAARLLGPMVDWGAAAGDVRLHASAAAFYDFALVRSLAIDEYIANVGADMLPTVLSEQRYYYAHGLTTRLRLRAEWKRLEMGFELGDDEFWAIRGLDRNQPPVMPPQGRDRRATRQAWLAVRPFANAPLRATVAADELDRQGHFGASDRALTELRARAALSLAF